MRLIIEFALRGPWASIWLFGLLWGVHILAGWSGGRRRGTGALMVSVLGWLVVSGYLLYYLSDETVRPLISLLHWVIGLAVPVAFTAHWVSEQSQVRRRRRLDSRNGRHHTRSRDNPLNARTTHARRLTASTDDTLPAGS